MMKILFITFGTEKLASSRVRVFQYLPYLEKENISSRVIVQKPHLPDEPKGFIQRSQSNVQKVKSNLQFLFYSFFYKILFIQKIYLPKFMLWLFRALNKTVIYDFDDAIYTNSKNNPIRPKKLGRLNYTLKKASLVTVENDANKKYSDKFNSNVVVITGPIECNRYIPKTGYKNEKVTIGWIGSPSTKDYLHLIESPLGNLQAKYPDRIELIFIGAKGLELKGVSFTNEPWDLNTEGSLLQKFDFGIMPLPDDLWSRGKGGYKLLQYMATGIPSVASPVGINNEIITHGVHGFLANNKEEWEKYMEILIEDTLLREKMGKASREKVLMNYSFEKYSRELISYIKSAMR